jgi:predicted kinase
MAVSGWRGWFASGSADCSYPVICVTSLNMRKWMRERIQRRKKKSEEQVNQPAPPPLQPAYFDAEKPSGAEPESRSEAVEAAGDREDREVEVQPVGEESVPAQASEEPESQATSSGSAQRTRGRRRRGGRGRGGRGREQAVAQAFTPKGIPGAVPVEEPESAEPETAEAEPALAGPADSETQPARAPQAPAVPAVVPSAPARPPKGIVVLAIGLPGSGKSSWFKRHNVVPLSTDMVRSLLFDDVREQRFQDLVFSNLRSMLKARLIAKRPMNYVDATNLTPQERQHWIKLAKDYNYEVHAVFFDVPLEVCLDRHQRRDRVVPEDVMRRMAAKLKPPSFQEGFAKITVVRVKKKDAEPAEQAEA